MGLQGLCGRCRGSRHAGQQLQLPGAAADTLAAADWRWCVGFSPTLDPPAVSDVLLALDWLKSNAKRPAVVSMSLGGAPPAPPRLTAAPASWPLPRCCCRLAAGPAFFTPPLVPPACPAPPSCAGEVQHQLDDAVRSLTEAGIHVVVAAGNEDMDACDTSPAREPSAVTVAASDIEDRRLWLSPGATERGGGSRVGAGAV